MNRLCFFLVRTDNNPELYTIVVEGEKDDVEAELNRNFAYAQFIKTIPLDSKQAFRYKGHRKLGKNIIRGCFYTQDLVPK